jgi:hypothetical protein
MLASALYRQGVAGGEWLSNDKFSRRRNLAATLRLRIAIIHFTCVFGLTPAKALSQFPCAASASSLPIVAASDLPDAPEDTQSAPAANSSSDVVAPADAGEEQQTKRTLWIMPNFRAVQHRHKAS